VFDYIEGDDTAWEKKPLETLASEGNLSAYIHDGFWYMMDSLRDKIRLNELWDSGRAPWKVWNDD
jgi:glucose-1-phosphate cytidylyltransferase